MKKGKSIITLLLAIVLTMCLLPVNQVSAAQTEPETVTEQEPGAENGDEAAEESMEQILSTNPEEAGDPADVMPEHAKTTYTENIFYSQTTLHGIFSSNELYFYVPEYWDTKYVYAEIQYDVSELIQSIASSMTFSVNNVPVSSCRVAYKDGETQICYVEIPTELLEEGYNSLSISAYARLYDEEGCIDDFTTANWLSISDKSYIECGYELSDIQNEISYYPYPFMSTVDNTGKGLSIAVSDKASDGEVTAAMNIMADLSTETGDDNEIEFCLLSDLNATNADRTVLVANYENLPAEYQSKVSNKEGLEERAEVNLIEDNAGNPLLLITSKDDGCLLEAAYMLMDENRVSQEKSSRATVKKGSADIAIHSEKASQLAAGNYTLKDIVGNGLAFVGPFHQEQVIYLPFSEDYFLADAGKVTLNFRYSENLDFNRSLISIYWGDVPVASKKLQKESAGGDELTFSMPADVVGTTTSAIRIVFDLEIPDMVCTPRQDQMPWAYVTEQSVLYLPTADEIVLSFDQKSSPFRKDGEFNDTMLVISDNPTTEELNRYAQIIGMYGDGVSPYGTFYVRRAGEFSKEDADYNIIVVGTYESNQLIQSLNQSLSFTYDESGKRFQSNEQLILSDDYAGKIAIMQLLKSPFAKNRGILAVTGSDEASLQNMESFMQNHEKRMSLSKDCVIIDADLETKAFQFISMAADDEEPGLVGSLTQNKQSLVFTVVATSVMAMLLIAVAIILIRIKMYHRKNDSHSDDE